MARFEERSVLTRDSVDADAGIIRGVKLLGYKSKNGRRYTNEAVKKAVPLYDGAKVYVNHPRRSDAGEDRPFQDWVGTVENPAERSDGIYGDIKLRKESTHYRGIIEAAKRFPKDVGFSHVAEGDSSVVSDTEIVESINEVFSVDLVTEPATTRGFFESNANRLTVRELAERLPTSNPFRAKLIEGINSGTVNGSMSFYDGNDKANAVDPLTLIYKALEKALDVLAAVVDSKSAPAPAGGESHNPGTTPFNSTDGNAVAESDGRYRERFEVRTGIARDTYETEFARAVKRAGQAVRK